MSNRDRDTSHSCSIFCVFSFAPNSRYLSRTGSSVVEHASPDKCLMSLSLCASMWEKCVCGGPTLYTSDANSKENAIPSKAILNWSKSLRLDDIKVTGLVREITFNKALPLT